MKQSQESRIIYSHLGRSLRKLPMTHVFVFLFVTTGISLNSSFLFAQELDVQSYHLQLEPNIQQQSIKGNVCIDFSIDPTSKEITLASGDLIITQIIGKHVENYQQKGKKVIISLSNRTGKSNQIQIFFHGTPKKGLLFNKNQNHAYTVYFTEEWMVCNPAPADKASFSINLIVPKNKTCLASGELKDRVVVDEKAEMYSFLQTYETPAYTYGFVLGNFTVLHEEHQGTSLSYYASKFSPKELEKIFVSTTRILNFFEEKSGLPYPQESYTQVLIGEHYQEMTGLAVLKNVYGDFVLKDSTETNLISHELAHQWWGNRITCKSWKHFWLNEGFATFMSAAVNESLFGEAKYLANIQAYQKVYEKIKAKGGDKSLVFENWNNPSQDDRNLVYFKGAYVLHLLRKEVGDQLFWQGIRQYSRQYFGHSVDTYLFQASMEKASQRSLIDFFEKWVY